jgi:hypothetical protein
MSLAKFKHVKFEVFTGVSIKFSVFWLVTPYGLVIVFNMSYKTAASMFSVLDKLIKKTPKHTYIYYVILFCYQ